ncbi:MAG TPA: methylated-DNA--[protein]-cysteine S-methyltransferase [Bacteroidales bacterium]|nr:methylated-DNA--[protein]-cysteine S-methyltransferase [Bacteroidales bacterium]
MDHLHCIVIKSPLGNIVIEGTKKFVTSVNFYDQEDEVKQSSNPLLKRCANQLHEYFNGKRKNFTIPVQQTGTDFQQQVWNELNGISFGHLYSYEDVAVKIKNKKIVRAVGHAVGRNHIAIIVPCHRVIGKHGDMTGYAGGLWRKQWLIEHEQYYLLNFTN